MLTSRSWVPFAPLALLALAACAPQSPDPEDGDKSAEIDGALRVCGDASGVQGIDVSQWQSKIDWSTVATTSVKFAIIRVSDGDAAVDKQFTANWTGAKKAGIVRGVYQFFRPAQDPTKQADLLINAMAQDPIGAGDFPAVIDVETVDGVSTATIRARMHTWLDRVEAKTGKKPIIYTAAFMQDVVGSGFSDYPLWVANYTSQCPQLPSGWGAWNAWQYSETGHVSGVPGSAVDRDIWNGSYQDLLTFVGSDAATPVPTTPNPTTPPAQTPPAETPPTTDPGDAPTDLVPADGASQSGSSVTLKCDSFAGASEYQFDIEYYTNGAWEAYYTYSPKAPDQTFWPVLHAAFRFRVRAVTANGDSDYSGWNRFAFGNVSLP